jgi:hypothetical protein
MKSRTKWPEHHTEFCSEIVKEDDHLGDLWEHNRKTNSRKVENEDADLAKLKLDRVKYWTCMDTNDLSRFCKVRECVGQLHRENPKGHPTHTEPIGKNYPQTQNYAMNINNRCPLHDSYARGPEHDCSGGFQRLPTNFSNILSEVKFQCFGGAGTSSIHHTFSSSHSSVAVNNH